jgi:hypothetical protein
MRKNWLLLSALQAGLGLGQARGEEALPRQVAPATARQPAPMVQIREQNGFQEVNLGGSGPSYLIDPRTETCAMVGPGGSLLAVDCAKLARNLPQVRDVISWLKSAPSAAPLADDRALDNRIRCKEGKCTVARELFEQLLADNNLLATSGRLVPSLKDGKPNGFKLYAIRPGSIFARLGLQNADLIKTINGLEISTPDKALEAYARLRNSPELSLALERHGQDVTLNVQIR